MTRRSIFAPDMNIDTGDSVDFAAVCDLLDNPPKLLVDGKTRVHFYCGDGPFRHVYLSVTRWAAIDNGGFGIGGDRDIVTRLAKAYTVTRDVEWEGSSVGRYYYATLEAVTV